MAIHGEVPGIEVTVCVAGIALTEYNVDNDACTHPNQAVRLHEKKCTKTMFVESSTGKEFTIKIRVKKPYHMDFPGLSFRTYVDGEVISKPLMRRADYSTRYWKSEVIGPMPKTSMFGPTTQIRTMLFSEIVSTSNSLPREVIDEHKEIMTSVGDIVVKVYRVSEGRRVQAVEPIFKEKIEVDKKYHEKALVKESKSHGTILGELLDCEPAMTFKVDQLDGADYPLLIFKFKYRCKEALQDLGLIPRANTKFDLRQLASLSREERQKAKRILESIDNEPIKDENPDENSIERWLDRAECTSRSSKRQRLIQNMDVIDLTGDDDDADTAENLRSGSFPCFIGGRRENRSDLTWTDFPL